MEKITALIQNVFHRAYDLIVVEYFALQNQSCNIDLLIVVHELLQGKAGKKYTSRDHNSTKGSKPVSFLLSRR